jgi:hypothetical protein
MSLGTMNSHLGLRFGIGIVPGTGSECETNENSSLEYEFQRNVFSRMICGSLGKINSHLCQIWHNEFDTHGNSSFHNACVVC